MCDKTRPVGAVVTYEDYCAAVGVSVRDARRASLIGALYAMLGGKVDNAPTPGSSDGPTSEYPSADTEPSAPTPDDTANNGQPF